MNRIHQYTYLFLVSINTSYKSIKGCKKKKKNHEAISSLVVQPTKDKVDIDHGLGFSLQNRVNLIQPEPIRYLFCLFSVRVCRV